MTTTTGERPRSADGIGLVEIVISIFLLGLLAVSVLPLMVNAMTTSRIYAEVATAGQLVGQEIERVRALPAPMSCAAIEALEGPGAEVTDTRGARYQPELVVGECPAAYPGVVSVTSEVTDAVSGDSLASAVTSVYVASP